MIIDIELPSEEEQVLIERARSSGRDLDTYVRSILRDHLRHAGETGAAGVQAPGANATIGDLIDMEAIASCERDADETITLEEVRAAMSKIKDSMARVVIEEERAERF